MTGFESTAIELNAEEMNAAAGGKSRYDKLAARDGFTAYKVQGGDTLVRIARRFNCTVDELLTWNPKITDRNTIYAGEYLYVRA